MAVPVLRLRCLVDKLVIEIGLEEGYDSGALLLRLSDRKIISCVVAMGIGA
jgi:hypothetical protein